MTLDELVPSWAEAAEIVAAACVIYVLLIVFSRLIGPRSFSQMTAFDFAVTVAMGAIVGGTATGGVPIYGGVLGMTALFTIRALVAVVRRHGLDRVFDNRAIVVMAGTKILEDNLRKAKVTRRDVLEGLRLAGVGTLAEVRAVVIERNGEFSVLRADKRLDEELLFMVVGAEHVPLTAPAS